MSEEPTVVEQARVTVVLTKFDNGQTVVEIVDPQPKELLWTGIIQMLHGAVGIAQQKVLEHLQQITKMLADAQSNSSGLVDAAGLPLKDADKIAGPN